MMSGDKPRAPTPRPARRGAQMIAFVVMAALLLAAPFVGLSGLPDEGAVLRAVRLRLQPADRLWRPAVVRPRDVLGTARLCLRPCAKVWGFRPSSAILAGTAAAARSGWSPARSRSAARASTSR
jgi:hypothetical protein